MNKLLIPFVWIEAMCCALLSGPFIKMHRPWAKALLDHADAKIELIKYLRRT